MSAPDPLLVYVDASYQPADDTMGLGLVCVSFDPWLACARFGVASSSTEAEVQAVLFAESWADDLPVVVFTDCQPIAKAPRRFGVSPLTRVEHVGRRGHAAIIAAHQLAGQARRTRINVTAHRLSRPGGWLETPVRVLVHHAPKSRWQDPPKLGFIVHDDGHKRVVGVQIDGDDRVLTMPRRFLQPVE